MTYHDIDIPLPAFIAIDWTGMTLALIPILFRFHLRRRQRHLQPQSSTRNLSDALVVLSWLSGIVLVSINTWKNSLRQHYTHHPPSTLYYGVPRPLAAHLLYVSWISLFFIYISLWSAKFALLAFYASLLRLQGRWARVTLACATLFAAGTFALHVALLTRWCRPVSANWNVDGELCSAVHDIHSVTVSTAANVATDLAILCIPLFALASLLRRDFVVVVPTNVGASASDGSGIGISHAADSYHLPQGGSSRSRSRSRWSSSSSSSSSSSLLSIGGLAFGKAELSGLALVLAMAALSITAATARFVTLELVRHVPKASITHTIDVWALVEIVASLLAVCLPSLRAFVRGRRRAAAGKRGGVSGDRSGAERRKEMVVVAAADGRMGEGGGRGSAGVAAVIEMEEGVRLGDGGRRQGDAEGSLSVLQEGAETKTVDARGVDSPQYLGVVGGARTANTSEERLL
ncbi:archaeal flagellin n-terminal-like domain-containing protein [Diplodia corticola]|uniref:Archaeal flagellin n-terminal-like domain-containing protein n=1 Tax=Diplodia corticola TaxID=236234 RepID=A0A1J9SLS9_9PEZI|nr:archaeal flagellin n-terminal-like domain-containing protein [Diplodia corticola]OJD40565.1 archaeal flagellin n-terminal-like domain-containing protein [Diplodia corticola]